MAALTWTATVDVGGREVTVEVSDDVWTVTGPDLPEERAKMLVEELNHATEEAAYSRFWGHGAEQVAGWAEAAGKLGKVSDAKTNLDQLPEPAKDAVI